jgi:hypothetical protein
MFFMTRIAKPVYLIVALALSAANVAAQQSGHSGTKDEQEACTPDVYKFCEAAIPDEDRIVACLKANLKLLSPQCRKVIRG